MNVHFKFYLQADHCIKVQNNVLGKSHAEMRSRQGNVNDLKVN